MTTPKEPITERPAVDPPEVTASLPKEEDMTNQTDTPRIVSLRILASSNFELKPEQALEWLQDLAPQFVHALWSTLQNGDENARDHAWNLESDLSSMIRECARAIADCDVARFEADPHVDEDWKDTTEALAAIVAARDEDEVPEEMGAMAYGYLAKELLVRIGMQNRAVESASPDGGAA